MATFCSEDSAGGALALQESHDRIICPSPPIVDLRHVRPIVGHRNQLYDDQEHSRPHNL